MLGADRCYARTCDYGTTQKQKSPIEFDFASFLDSLQATIVLTDHLGEYEIGYNETE